MRVEKNLIGQNYKLVKPEYQQGYIDDYTRELTKVYPVPFFDIKSKESKLRKIGSLGVKLISAYDNVTSIIELSRELSSWSGLVFINYFNLKKRNALNTAKELSTNHRFDNPTHQGLHTLISDELVYSVNLEKNLNLDNQMIFVPTEKLILELMKI